MVWLMNGVLWPPLTRAAESPFVSSLEILCGQSGRLGLGLFPAALGIGRLTMPWDWRGYVNERFREEEEEDFRNTSGLSWRRS